MAAEGIRALARALPRVVRDPANLEARIGTRSMVPGSPASSWAPRRSVLHHKLCHTLGGTFNLPHAEVHTVILPHATAYNRDAAPEAMRIAAQALGVADAAQGIFDLIVRHRCAEALKDIGMPGTASIVRRQLATENQYPNPRSVEYGLDPGTAGQRLLRPYRP